MCKKLTVIAFALCLALAFSFREAKATLITVDDSRYGPASIFLDTKTGLQWMKYWTVLSTFRWGNNFVESLYSSLSPYGSNYDWQLASSVQVRTLLGHAGLPTYSSGFKDTTGKYTAAMTSFQDVMGAWWGGSDDIFYTRAIVNDKPQYRRYSLIEMYSLSEGRPAYYVENYSSGVLSLTGGEDNQRGEMSAWLFRPTPVPEPSTFALLASSLLGLIIWRRKQNN